MLLLVRAVVAVGMVAVAAAEQPTVKVTLKQGAILGSQHKATNGRVYYSFKVIPYAKPPVGPLRLKDPEPALDWSGVRNGSLPIPMCPQCNFLVPGTVEGQEDCLYLNVYTPTLYPANLPVMVYIHGGGFQSGSAEAHGTSPEPLMQKDVVVVSINYRLGALGFLSTGDSVLPGNLGLKDQTLALRWVQDNIRDLGGDPHQVTIFGVSAGGMSVQLHILSPTSAGLFQRAIIQSGTALMPGFPTSSRHRGVDMSKALNCTGEESHQLLACFQEADVKDLVLTLNSLGEWFNMPKTVGPRVDGTFLPDHPAALLKAGRYNAVDVMCGATQDDGNVFTAALFSKFGKEAFQEMMDNFTKVGPILLAMTEEENPVYLARRVFLNYMTDLNMTMEDEFALTSLVSDSYFRVPSAQTVEFHVRDQRRKTFMYELHHRLEKSLMSILTNTSIERQMAGHGDDALLLFQLPPPLNLHRPQDLHMRDILVTLWTNFASTGNPTVSGTLGFRWTPVAPTGPLRYLSLTTTPTMQPVDSRNHHFWSSLPTKTNKLLYPELFLEDVYNSA